MRPVVDFLPRVLPYLPGCPDPLALQSIVDSAIAFCEESLVLRQKLDTFDTTVDVESYTLDVPAGQQPARVMKVWIDGKPINPVPSDVAIPVNVDSRRPVAFFTTRVDSEFLLGLYPPPDDVYTVMVEVALRPQRAASSLQDDLYDLWLEPVVDGAIGRCMATPGNAFSDQSTAESLRLKALIAARKARVEGGFGRVKATVRVAPRPFL